MKPRAKLLSFGLCALSIHDPSPVVAVFGTVHSPAVWFQIPGDCAWANDRRLVYPDGKGTRTCPLGSRLGHRRGSIKCIARWSDGLALREPQLP